MLTEIVIAYFKNQAKVARVLGISRAAVAKWGRVIPEGSAYKLESLTGGALKVDPTLYAKGASKHDSAVAAA